MNAATEVPRGMAALARRFVFAVPAEHGYARHGIIAVFREEFGARFVALKDEASGNYLAELEDAERKFFEDLDALERSLED